MHHHVWRSAEECARDVREMGLRVLCTGTQSPVKDKAGFADFTPSDLEYSRIDQVFQPVERIQLLDSAFGL